jgi:4'-phosphopantetheinyl transferase
MSRQQWCVSDRPIAPRSDQVHVWRSAVDLTRARLAWLGSILDSGEQARAERFRLERDRCRYMFGRGMLRVLLARYLDCDPRSLRFEYGPFGKPALDAAEGRHALRFNVSHSDGLMLYAVTCDREVGVDVERVRTDWRIDRPNQFFAAWTRYEASAKARGAGLDDAISIVDAGQCSVQPLAPGPSYVGAVALAGSNWQLQCLEFPQWRDGHSEWSD